jgi:hypothetical protein
MKILIPSFTITSKTIFLIRHKKYVIIHRLFCTLYTILLYIHYIKAKKLCIHYLLLSINSYLFLSIAPYLLLPIASWSRLFYLSSHGRPMRVLMPQLCKKILHYLSSILSGKNITTFFYGSHGHTLLIASFI